MADTKIKTGAISWLCLSSIQNGGYELNKKHGGDEQICQKTNYRGALSLLGASNEGGLPGTAEMGTLWVPLLKVKLGLRCTIAVWFT